MEWHHPSAGLIIEDNVASVAPGFQWTSAFVGDWSGEGFGDAEQPAWGSDHRVRAH
jgi:hypothetical protein